MCLQSVLHSDPPLFPRVKDVCFLPILQFNAQPQEDIVPEAHTIEMVCMEGTGIGGEEKFKTLSTQPSLKRERGAQTLMEKSDLAWSLQ